MILKQIPEDFIVEEISLKDFALEQKGKYQIYELKKKEKNTEQSIIEISKKFNIERKNISYAGTKDKNAITTQKISILTNKDCSIQQENIILKYLGKSNEPLSLGRLKGNSFNIVIRGLKGTEKIENKKIINYFHEQRFSKNNVEIGKLLLKKKYETATNILIKDKIWGIKIKQHLEKSLNDYVGALKTIPKKILTLYVHAYQSHLWNKTIKLLLKQNNLPNEVPIPGFSNIETDKETEKIINNILSEENIVLKDFINKDIPYLSTEGTTRKTIIYPKNFKKSTFLDDELNKGYKKIKISFDLNKGEYATNVIEQLFNNS